MSLISSGNLKLETRGFVVVKLSLQPGGSSVGHATKGSSECVDKADLDGGTDDNDDPFQLLTDSILFRRACRAFDRWAEMSQLLINGCQGNSSSAFVFSESKRSKDF